MTSPEEEQRKRSAEAKAKEPDKPGGPIQDGLDLLGQLVSDARNQATDAVLGTHSGDKVLSGITPQLAAQYQHGKEVQERIARGAVKESQLSEADRKSLDAFNSVRKTIAQVPLYDRDSLMRYVEKGIEQKARTAPQEAIRPAAARDSAYKQEVVKPLAPSVTKEAGDAKKGPAQAGPPPHKETANFPSLPSDSKLSGSRPAQAQRPSDLHPIDARIESRKSPPERVSTAFSPEAKTDSRQHISAPGGNVIKEPRTPEAMAPHSSTGEKNRAADAKAISRTEESQRPNQKGERSELTSARSDISSLGAVSTFERRTGYDARNQPESKQKTTIETAETQLIGRTTHTDVHIVKERDSTAAHPRSASSSDPALPAGVHYGTAFANMRRVLEERSYFAQALAQRIQLSPQLNFRHPSQPEARDTAPPVARTAAGAERRQSLFEIKNSLPAQRIEQIAHTAAERFPAGLRWQSQLGRPDGLLATSNKRIDSLSQPAAQTGKSVEVNPLKVADGGRGAVKESQSGAFRVTASATPGDQQAGGWRSAQSGFISLPEGKNFTIRGRAEDRYITGAEIALAAVIAAAGARRVRHDQPDQSGQHAAGASARVQKVEAFPASQPRADTAKPAIYSSTFRASEKRFFTGAEIALAAVIASCGTARIRQSLVEKSKEPGGAPDSQSSATTERWAGERESSGWPADDSSAQQISKTDDNAGRLARRSKDLPIENDKPFNEETCGDDIPGTLGYLQKHKYNRQTILIGPCDTLVSIADAVLETPNYAWLIADINMQRVRQTWVDGKRIVEVRSRQLLELPSAEDIQAFHRHWRKEFKPENLITIVIETQVDRELLNEHFGVFVEGGTKTPVSPPGPAAGALARTAFGADGAALLPALALESGGILKVVSAGLLKLTGSVLQRGRKPFFAQRENLSREKIRRRL